MFKRYVRATLAGLLACSLIGTTAACVTNEELGNPDGWEEILPPTHPELAALVPENIRAKGSIEVGTNPPFAPNEFKDSQGNIIGIEMDFIRAAGSLLGLNVNIRQMDFNLILPAISAGTLDVGASGFTDTEERQKVFDFVDFLNSGITWATQPGNEHNIDPDNACGLTVSVQQGTYADTEEIQKKSEACESQGKEPIHKMVYSTADAAATAAILKRADAYSSDSSVIAYAVKRSDNQLVQVGSTFDTAPYGMAVAKGNPLAHALSAALQYMLNSGDIDRILKPWGLEQSKRKKITLNAKAIDPQALPAAARSQAAAPRSRKKAH